MRTWRIRWIAKHLASWENYRRHRDTLKRAWPYYFGLIAKAIPGLHRAPILLTLANGFTIEARGWSTLFIYHEIFVDKCYDMPLSSNAPTIIDVGANTGLFCLRMKQLYPQSRLICFEPYPPNYQMLTGTIQRNKLQNVEALPQAVAASRGSLKLYIHPTNVGGHSIYSSRASDNSVDIEAVTLSQVLQERGIETCDLLKLDCEGAEKEILMSLDRETANRFPCIVFEPTPTVYSVDDVRAHLTSLGYDVTNGARGLIVARRAA